MIMKSKQKSKVKKVKKAKKEISIVNEEKVSKPIDSEDEETDLEDEWRRLSDEEECVWDRIEPDSEAETLEDATNRLCMKHMDWEKVKARDIFHLITSFLPEGGKLHRVTVYPSEEGLLQMDVEEAAGPSVMRDLDKLAETDGDVKLPAEVSNPSTSRKKQSKHRDEPDEDEVVTDEQWRRLKKCREYEIARLKYFYAILDFESPETANSVYETVDGAEYEASGCRVDLYFVEDGRVVDRHLKGIPNEDKWRALISTWPEKEAPQLVSDNYQPPVFTNNALRHSHQFTLSWDETPSERIQWMQSIAERNDFDEDWQEEADISRYVAVSDSGEEEEDKEEMERKKKLIRDILRECDDKERKQKRRLERGLMKAKAAAGIDVDMDMESSDSDDDEEEEEAKDVPAVSEDEEEEDMRMKGESEDSESEEEALKMKKSKPMKQRKEMLAKKKKLKAARKVRAEESEESRKPKKKPKEKLQEPTLTEDGGKKGGGRKRRSQKQLAKAKRKAKEMEGADANPELSLLVSDLKGPKKCQLTSSAKEDPRFAAIFDDPDFSVDTALLSRPSARV